MDLLQDILFYIVIGLIVVISSYLSPKKAKKQAEEIERRRRQQQESTSRETPVTNRREDSPPQYDEVLPQEAPSVDEIFKALRERKPLPTSKPAAQPMQEITVTTTPAMQPQVATPPPTAERAQVKRTTPEQISSITSIQPANTEKHTYKPQAINWREAFIASEILNRKY